MTSTTAAAEHHLPEVPDLPEAVEHPGPTYNVWFGRFLLLLIAVLLLVGGFVLDGEKATTEQAADGMIGEFDGTVPVLGLPELKLGPIDMTITKPVLYMFLASLLCVGFSIWQARRMRPRPDRRQTFVETMYEFLHDQVAKATLPEGSIFRRYMPYLASVFLFIWVMNLVSFIPLPFGAHSWIGEQGGPEVIKDLGLYAATSNINVTFALTLATLTIAHVLGVRTHGVIGYLKTWAPPGGLGLKVFMWIIHAIGELVKFVSLSVRLFANMLTGHMLILVMFTIIFVVGTPLVGIATVPVAVLFFLFEVGLVATLQAYIFAVLSGTYIGMASSEEH